jgi:hypothetical protein
MYSSDIFRSIGKSDEAAFVVARCGYRDLVAKTSSMEQDISFTTNLDRAFVGTETDVWDLRFYVKSPLRHELIVLSVAEWRRWRESLETRRRG